MADPAAEIIMIAGENLPAYSRVMTSYYLAGAIAREKVFIRDPDFYRRLRIDTLFGHQALAVRPGASQVLLDDDTVVNYDNLLVATGSVPVRPDLPGLNLDGVHFHWTLADADGIMAAAATARRAIVIGAGLIGMQTAVALRRRGLDVTVVEAQPRVIPAQLDAGAAGLMQAALEQNGVQLRLGVEVKAIAGTDRVSGVRLEDDLIEAGLVVVAVGVKPNLSVVRESGLAIEDGILVDRRLRSSVPNIYAAGDVACAYDPVRGAPAVNAMWPNAVQQGRVAGRNMAGLAEEYPGGINLNTVEFFGLTAVSMGVVNPSGPEYQEIVRSEPERGLYRKLVLRDGRLAGMIFAGEIEKAGILSGLLVQGKEAGHLVETLLSDDLSYPKLLMNGLEGAIRPVMVG